MKVKVRELKCNKCGHEWYPRSTDVRMCPKCKSVNWDKEKKEATGIRV